MRATAVVFAYHDVGCRCLSVLLARGVRVALVVTHRDNPAETIWFGSVERLARGAGLEVAMPDDPNDPAFVARLAAIAPDFLFSFYYRQMLGPELLALPNFLLTPHVAWSSRPAMQALADQLIDNIEAFVAGAPKNRVA